MAMTKKKTAKKPMAKAFKTCAACKTKAKCRAAGKCVAKK